MPVLKVPSLDVPPAPEIGVGPAALSVQALAEAVPPASLMTFLTKVRLGAVSSLVIVQVTKPPTGIVPEQPAPSVLA